MNISDLYLSVKMGSDVSKAARKRLGAQFMTAVATNDTQTIKELYLKYSEDLDVIVYTSYLALQKRSYPAFYMSKVIYEIVKSDLPIYSWLLCKYHEHIAVNDIKNAYLTNRITKKSLIALAEYIRYAPESLVEWMAVVGVPADAFYMVRTSRWSTGFCSLLDTKAENVALKFDLAVILGKRQNHPLMIAKDMMQVIYSLALQDDSKTNFDYSDDEYYSDDD